MRLPITDALLQSVLRCVVLCCLRCLTAWTGSARRRVSRFMSARASATSARQALACCLPHATPAYRCAIRLAQGLAEAKESKEEAKESSSGGGPALRSVQGVDVEAAWKKFTAAYLANCRAVLKQRQEQIKAVETKVCALCATHAGRGVPGFGCTCSIFLVDSSALSDCVDDRTLRPRSLRPRCAATWSSSCRE